MARLWEKLVALAASNLGLRVLAVVIALGLWLAGHRDIERTIEVPVEFRNIPPDLMVVENHVDYVVLRVAGPRTLVSTLDSDELKLSLDLSDAKPGVANYPLSSSSFNIPRGVTVARITPPVINLRLEPMMVRSLPVVVRFAGKVPEGYVVAATAVEPHTVSVQGPVDEVRKLAFVETLPVDLEEDRNMTRRRVRLSADGKPLKFSPDQVTVTVTLKEEQVTRDFTAVQVRAKDFEGAYTVKPSTVFLRLAGPRRLITQLEPTPDRVYLDLKGLDAGEHVVGLSFDLPPEVKVVEAKPQQFKVRIKKAAS
ncbi:MAG TPA: CdaR family protein [candidate division Zixibacteria bacterium]|nr:CdaR family protein [candidate division Zixibacteria bacterium]